MKGLIFVILAIFIFGCVSNQTQLEVTELPEDSEIQIEDKSQLSIDNIEFGEPTMVFIRNDGEKSSFTDSINIIVNGNTETCVWESDEISIQSGGIASCTIESSFDQDSSVYMINVDDVESGIIIINYIEFEDPQIISVLNSQESDVEIDDVVIIINNDIVKCTWDESTLSKDGLKLYMEPKSIAECSLDFEVSESDAIYAGIIPAN